MPGRGGRGTEMTGVDENGAEAPFRSNKLFQSVASVVVNRTANGVSGNARFSLASDIAASILVLNPFDSQRLRRLV